MYSASTTRLGGFYPRGLFSGEGAFFPGGFFPRGHFSGGAFSRGGGIFPGTFSPGAFFLGKITKCIVFEIL